MAIAEALRVLRPAIERNRQRIAKGGRRQWVFTQAEWKALERFIDAITASHMEPR
jgi:hypothetical protein